MQIILEPYTVPERGTFQIQETVTIQISADEARRLVDTWLLHQVNSQMGADQPVLVVGERSVWRVPVYWSAPHAGRVGLVGVVEVDVLSGKMDTSPQRIAEFTTRAKSFVSEFSPYQARNAAATYYAAHSAPTHPLARPTGSPRDLLAKLS